MALLQQSARFLIVGLANTSIGLAVIYGLMLAGTGTGLANFLGYAVGLTVSFLLNRTWTFASDEKSAATLPKYLTAAVVCYGLNLALVLTATRHFGVNRYLAQLFGIGVYTGAMFFACRQFVFTKDAKPQIRKTPSLSGTEL